MATTLEPLPIDAPMVNPDGLTITAVWYRHLSVAILARLASAPYVSKAATLADQSAALGATSLGAGSAGLYRVSWFVRITQAATVSSSFTITIAHTDGAQNVAQVGAALTGNTVTTVQSGSFLVRADAATAITYAVAYASVGATVMKYTVSVSIETVNA